MADVEAEIAKFFQTVDEEHPDDFRFSDSDIRRLSSLLSILPQAKPSWSRVPRAFIVLKLIGKEALLDEFLRQGFSDYLFPVGTNGLPNCLDAKGRVAFIKTQRLVCTKAVDLEKGGHQVFAADQSDDLFTVNRVLGTSTSSQVDHVTSNLSFEEYARKRIIRRTVGQRRFSETASIFTGELKILKRLKHEHIVSICGTYTDPKYFVLLLSPVADCNLTEYFAQVLGNPKLKATLRTFFGCLATAVAYLHDNLIKHKDVKPQNILVHRGTVLLTDFGIAKLAEDASGVTTDGWTLKTPRYCAPEVAAYDKRNNSSDVWSLGCVFLEIITTLKGLTVADMVSFFHANGSRETNMSANEEAIAKWIGHLKEVAHPYDNDALTWITPMLQYSRDARPTARQVVRMVYDDRESNGPHMYGGLCCNSDIEDDKVSEFGFSSSVERIPSRDDPLERSVEPPEAFHRAEESYTSEAGVSSIEHPNHLSHPSVTKLPSLVIYRTSLDHSVLDISRRVSQEELPLETLHVNSTTAVLPDRSRIPLHSAANAAAMRIYKSAMRQHGRNFADAILDYVHDGGHFRKDALIRAISKDELAVMEFLLQSGLDANAMIWQTDIQCNPLGAAMARYVGAENTTAASTIILLEHGGRLESVPRDLKSQCLERACARADVPFVEKLFDSGYSIRHLEDSHRFLSAACKSCDPPADSIVDMLLQHGVRHWPRSKEEESAMHRTLGTLFAGRYKFKYLAKYQARAKVLLLLLRAGILPQTPDDRQQAIRSAILFNKLEIIDIMAQGGQSMTSEEASFGMQLWHFDYSEPWPKSSLYWHKIFWMQGLPPFKKMEFLPEFQNEEFTETHPFLYPITFYLTGMASAIDEPDHPEWEQLVKDQFASVSGPFAKADIECWPFVDLLLILQGGMDDTLNALEQAGYEKFLAAIVKLSGNIQIPLTVRRSGNHALFCDSELVAAIFLGYAPAVRVLLDAGADVNGAILDRASDIYRSPLNFALDPLHVEIPWLQKLITRESIDLEDRRRHDVVELLKERGAKNFTKERSAFNRLSRSLKLRKA